MSEETNKEETAEDACEVEEAPLEEQSEVFSEEAIENVAEPPSASEDEPPASEVKESGGEEEEAAIGEVKNDEKLTTDKSRHLSWSYTQWSKNFESQDDERQMEDLNDDPQRLILWAAEKNELETLRNLLASDPNLVNARDNDLYTPLHRASYSNNVEVIKILLSYDADISAKTTDGWEPLHCACKWDSIEAVSLLLQNGADVNAETNGHLTPLHLAASNVSGRRTLELLLWHPYINPNVKNDAGDTAYDIAYRAGPLGNLFEILEESINVY